MQQLLEEVIEEFVRTFEGVPEVQAAMKAKLEYERKRRSKVVRLADEVPVGADRPR